MAYNASQGPRELGDIKNEDDPDTQVDFSSDQIALKTGGVDRITVTNNHVSSSVNLSASAFYGNGANLTNVDVTPAGANTQIQFNDGGSALGASANLTFSSNTLSVVGQISSSLGVSGSALETRTTVINDSHISSSVPISGAVFHGVGAELTGLPVQTYSNASNNRVLTSVSANEIAGESNLTFDGSVLTVTGQVSSSLGVTGSRLQTPTTIIDDLHLSSSVNIGGAAFFGDAQFMSNLPNVPVSTYNNAGANRVITSTGAGGIEGEVAMTFNGSILSVIGQVSASLGVTGSRLQTPTTFIDDLHVSSSLNISGAAFYGDGANLTNVPASPVGSNFNVLFNDDGDLGASNNFIFDGSKVGVGGQLSASLGITGSALEIDNNAIISGSLRTKQVFTTYSAWNNTSTNIQFVPFYNVTDTSSPNHQTVLLKPLNGKLIAATWRCQNSQGGNNVTLGLHTSSAGSEAPGTGYNSETVTITQNGAWTPVTFVLTGSQHYTAGQVVAISIDPNNSAGEQNITCLWEYDVFGMGV